MVTFSVIQLVRNSRALQSGSSRVPVYNIAEVVAGPIPRPKVLCVQLLTNSSSSTFFSLSTVKLEFSQRERLNRLVNLQSLIQDHENMLSDLIRSIDKHFEDDRLFPLVGNAGFHPEGPA